MAAKEMKKVFYLASAVLLTVFLMACNCINREKHVAGEPDIVSSIKMNQDENLVIVANRDEIEDKVEFAKLLVKMCQENSFQSIKFSTDVGYATSLDMRVYLWRDEIEGNEPVMIVQFKPVDRNQEYDIVNNPEMYELYVDGELIKSTNY